MGGFIKCMKQEYNLEKEGTINEDENDYEDDEEEEEEANKKEKQYIPKDVQSLRNKSEAQIHTFNATNNSNTIHYNENYLDIKGEFTRKKSNTVFFKTNFQNNI